MQTLHRRLVLQGVSFRNELALTDIDMQVRFGLKMVLNVEIWNFWVPQLFFKKGNISWPRWPPTERVPDIR